MYGAESIKQVHGSIIEFLGTITKDALEALKIWFYDDMCHMKPYSEKPKNINDCDIAEKFAELPKAVDKFHFPGHKSTDRYCRENCDPKVELEN